MGRPLRSSGRASCRPTVNSRVGVRIGREVEQLLECFFLFLARVDQTNFGADVGGEQVDHVVAQGLGGRDHLALEHEEPHHVGGRAVEPRTQIESAYSVAMHAPSATTSRS